MLLSNLKWSFITTALADRLRRPSSTGGMLGIRSAEAAQTLCLHWSPGSFEKKGMWGASEVGGENGIDIFRPYSRPNPFRGV